MPNDILADDIFGDAVDAYHNLGTPQVTDTGNDDAKDVSSDTQPDPNTQDVDPKGQGQKDDKSAPVTPDESADTKKPDDGKEPVVDAKKKVEGAAEARKWGEEWQRTAQENERKFKEAEEQLNAVKPILEAVDTKFGGEKNLALAAEVYGAIVDPDNFDPANALEFLSENFSGVAQKLTTYIGQELIQRATDTAITRTFGRQLNDGDIKAVRDFLAAGKPSNLKNFDTFFQTDDIPDEMKLDAEGQELPPHIVDYMRRQNASLREIQTQTESLRQSMDGAKSEQEQVKAAEAVENYMVEGLSPIIRKSEALGLDKPIEGETPELKQFREDCFGLLDALTLYKANSDKGFKAVLAKAQTAVARHAANPKDKVSEAQAGDSLLRIQAMIGTFAGQAADFIAPLVESLAAKRGAQVKKVESAPADLDSPSTGKDETPRAPSYDPDDPFADVDEVVKDKIRSGEIKLKR